jgi:hypothetical protein
LIHELSLEKSGLFSFVPSVHIRPANSSMLSVDHIQCDQSVITHKQPSPTTA